MKAKNMFAVALGAVIGLPKAVVSTGGYIVEKTRVKMALDDINRELSRPERLSDERKLELEFAKEEAENLLAEGESDSPAPGFVERLKGFKLPSFKSDPVETVQKMAVKK